MTFRHWASCYSAPFWADGVLARASRDYGGSLLWRLRSASCYFGVRDVSAYPSLLTILTCFGVRDCPDATDALDAPEVLDVLDTCDVLDVPRSTFDVIDALQRLGGRSLRQGHPQSALLRLPWRLLLWLLHWMGGRSGGPEPLARRQWRIRLSSVTVP